VKIIDRGSAKPTDPIYSGGWEMFTPGRFKPAPATPADQQIAPSETRGADQPVDGEPGEAEGET